MKRRPSTGSGSSGRVRRQGSGREGGRSGRDLALDLALALAGSLLAALAVPVAAQAYVDPSVVTYTIQAVAGVAVALGAVLGVAFRRTRRAIYRLLRIDENANKTVDPEVHFLKEGLRDGSGPRGAGAVTREEADERARALLFEASHGRPPRRLVWPMRLLLALIASTFTVSTIFIFTPLELVAASSESLMFGLFDVSDLLIGVGLVIALGVGFAISAIRGTVFDVVVCVLVGIGVGCFLQALFLNVSLPAADGTAFTLADHPHITVIDTLVWAGLLTALILFTLRKRQLARVFLPFLCLVLLLVQIVSMAGVAEEERLELAAQGDSFVMTTEGLGEVGAEGDVTVFVLDTFDTVYLDDIIAADPGTLDEFTGFTYFHNSTGSMIPTRYGVPFLLTNAMAQPGETFEGYMGRRYAESPFLGDIADAGYEIGIYTDTVDLKAVEPYAMNIHSTHDEREFDEVGLWTDLGRMALFREAPWLLKPLFRFYTGDLDAAFGDSYTTDNVDYYRCIHDEGLTVSDTASKTFRFIHTSGVHWPHTMDQYGNRVGPEEVTYLEQGMGVIGYVDEYLRELKRLGLYDQSTIIVTADHGAWEFGMKLMERESSPIMLVKPPETPEEAAQPLKVSYAPTGHLDYAATVIQGVGGDAGAYGPTVFDIPEGPRDRPYWYVIHDGHTDYELVRYLIQGDAVNFDDWHVTGETIFIEPGGLSDPAVMNPIGVAAGLIPGVSPDPAPVESGPGDADVWDPGDGTGDQGTPDDGWQGY